jgi:hypothetical protein
MMCSTGAIESPVSSLSGLRLVVKHYPTAIQITFIEELRRRLGGEVLFHERILKG